MVGPFIPLPAAYRRTESVSLDGISYPVWWSMLGSNRSGYCPKGGEREGLSDAFRERETDRDG